MKKHSIGFTLVISAMMLLNSCGIIGGSGLLKRGEFQKTEFFEEIDFEYFRNLILIDIEIEGNTYSFIFDTGAEVSLLDAEILDKIAHKELKTKNVSGASGVINRFKFIEIPKVKIGEVDFDDLVIISSDFFSAVNSFNCGKTVHGIIGTNMMRKAKWRIDYQDQKIWFSDKLSSFNDLEDDIVVDLNCGKIGRGRIMTLLDGVEGYYTFDTGKSTKFQTNITTFNKIVETKKDTEYTESKGITGITLNGIQYGTTKYTLIDEFKVGGLVLKDQIIEIQENENASSLMGNEIWKNYRVTIDWDNCNLYLHPIEEIEKDTLYNFEYSITVNESGKGLKLTKKWLQHSSTFDISDDNEIVSIEGINLSGLDDAGFCNFVEVELPIYKKKDKISITLINNGSEEKIVLHRERLLPK